MQIFLDVPEEVEGRLATARRGSVPVLHLRLGRVVRLVPLAFLSRIIETSRRLASPDEHRESPACPALRLLSRAASLRGDGTWDRLVRILIYHVACVRDDALPESANR